MSTTETEVKSLRHPDFYFKDGTAIFKLTSMDCQEGVLYNLHHGLLARRSTVFLSLFSLPRGPTFSDEIMSEGQNDDNPIHLFTVSRHDFDMLLIYLYRGPSMYPKSDAFLVSVMNLSAFFDISDGIEYTTQALEGLGDKLHPALQFELARCFRIDAWVEPSFRRLMDLSILELDSFRVTQIGHHGYFWLTQTKAKLQALRTKIAFNVPPLVNSGDCETPGPCIYAWNREWQERVRQLIHHPDDPISCLDLLHQLRNTHIEGLCDGCQDLTVTWIWGKLLLTQEDRIVEEAVEALMSLQTDEPIRAALRASVAAGVSII